MFVNYDVGAFGKIWTFLEGSSLNIFVLHTWLHSFWCLTFQLFKYSLHSPDLLLHLTSFTFFHSHGLSSHHSVLCFPFFFFFYRAYSNFLLHLLLCLFLLNEWSLHVTNFVVLWFSSHSLSQNSWERGKSTRYSAMSNSSLQYYFWPEWQNFTQNRPEFGMTQNMGVTCTSLSTRTKNSSHSSKNIMEFKTLPQPPSSSLFLFLFIHYFFSLN